LEIELLGGYEPELGNSFDLLDFASATGSFAFSLPQLPRELRWDTTQLLTTGTMSVQAIPEPATSSLGVMMVLLLMNFGRRF